MFIYESGISGRPTIVFLHGNGASGAMWKTCMEQLVDYHCLAPDFPGFGRSNDREWVSLDETTDLVAELIRNRGLKGRAHVVGLSLGSSVTITLLSRAPQAVDHAIVDGAGVLPLPGLTLMRVGFRLLQPFLHTDFFFRTIARSMKIPDHDYNDFRQGMLAVSPSSFRPSFLQANALRQPPGLERVESPVLFVAGGREAKAVRRSNAMLAGLMPNAQSRIVPGKGHGWLAEAPDLHYRMVRAWASDQTLPRELQAGKRV